MFRIGDKIRLKQELVDNYYKHGKRPDYFNDGGYMDYMFDGRVMTVLRVDKDFKVFVDREEWHPYHDIETWMLLVCDVEHVVVDNRLLA